MKNVTVADFQIGEGRPLALIAGPCVIESEAHCIEMATAIAEISRRCDIPTIFKSSFDKANRSSIDSYRGPGMENGLEILAKAKKASGLPLLSDIHESAQADEAAQILDVIQIPAFLCRQTDLLFAAAKTGLPVNVKKGQMLAPWDMAPLIEKIVAMGNGNVLLTERGTSFGYNRLVSDMRSLALMRELGHPVVFDATHSVQEPGGLGVSSGGKREHVPLLARAAVAAGVDAVFLEVHDKPDDALCDGPNMIELSKLEQLIESLKAIRAALIGG